MKKAKSLITLISISFGAPLPGDEQLPIISADFKISVLRKTLSFETHALSPLTSKVDSALEWGLNIDHQRRILQATPYGF